MYNQGYHPEIIIRTIHDLIQTSYKDWIQFSGSSRADNSGSYYILLIIFLEMASDYCIKLKELLKTDLYVIKATNPPKYLSCFGINKEDVIIIHKWEKVQESFYRSLKLSSVCSPTEFEVTGQPLESPFTEGITLDDTIFFENKVLKTEEDFHAPLNATEARLCLGTSNLYLKPDVPVWVLKEPEGKENIVLIGSQFHNGWCFRSWVNIHGIEAITDNIKSMINEHKKIAMLPDAQLKSKVTSYFNTCDAEEIENSGTEESVNLEVTWTKPSYDVPLSEADTSVIVKAVVGSKDNITSPLWQQVLLLNMYLDTTAKWRKERLQQVPYQRDLIQIPSSRDVFPNSEKAKESLTDQVLHLLKTSDHVSLVHNLKRSKADFSRKTKEIVAEVTSGQRPGQDFTDKLWTLLIDANMYQELSSLMQLVFQKVKTQMVKPYIMRNNKTRLAQALHSANSGINTELMFEPLEILLELGLEKLKHDYLYIFKLLQLENEELLVVPDLQSFSKIPSSDWESTVRSWLNWFARIQTILDIVCLTEQKLGSNICTLTSVSSVALKTYLGEHSSVTSIKDIIENPIQEIKAAIKTTDVSWLIGTGRQFYKWLLNLTSTSASRSVCSSYLVSLSLPFPENITKNVIEKSSLEETVFPDETVFIYDVNSMYYSAKLVTVGDKLY